MMIPSGEPRRRRRRRTVLVISLLLCVATTAVARPFLLLNNPRPKCITTNANEGLTVSVDYEAPDLVTLDDVDEDGASDKTTPFGADATDAAGNSNKGPDEARKDAANKDKQGPNSGLDKNWNEKRDRDLKRMKKRRNELKGTRITDMTITINEKGDTVNQARGRFNRNRGKPKPLANVSRDIEDKVGTITLEATRDGLVEICVQSMSASHNLPSLVHLSVREDLQEKKEKEIEKSDKRHMSNIETTLRSLIRRLAMIQKSADFAKEQEYEFHETSINMNKAMKTWPLMHCIMLLITGFTMARHMTSYLKGHHIY